MEKVKKSPSLRLGPRRDVDMTEGNIFGHIIRFAIPLLIGNLFQQLYNMVDTWVVGRFVSDTAFSAVGTVGPIINMLIGFFLGLSGGAGVVISQYYGAKEEEKVKKAVHTSLVMTVALAVVFTVVGILIVPYMLKLNKTPESVLPEATAYLTIYFAGVAGLMIYNMGAGILRAVGDSKRPFYFLVISAVTNTVLDLVFVLAFGMGVEGVAYATIIAQGLSAVLTIIVLCRSRGCIRLRLTDFKADMAILKKIVIIGIPTAIQVAITGFSNTFVQGYINHFGDVVMGGWTAYSKVDALMFMPMQSISLAATTFVGQNIGKGQVDRAKRGVRYALYLALLSTAIVMIPIIVFAPYTVRFFVDTPEIVEYGTLFLQTITPFYLLCAFNQIYAGVLRGAGDTLPPTIIMVSSFVLFRQAYLFVMANYISNTIMPIAMSYPAGWLVASIASSIYYRFTDLTKTRVVEKKVA